MEKCWIEKEVTGELNGRLVVFKCRYWAKDVTVEMISPLPGRKNSVHMLYCVPLCYTDGDHWRHVAWNLVRELLDCERAGTM